MLGSRWPRTSAAALLATLVWAQARDAAAYPLMRGLGGPAGYGVNNLPANDDGSTGEIDLRAAFPSGLYFFGRTFRSLYLNNNGNVTFGGALGQFTPQRFPVANRPMIAPWWGDVDTRGGGYPGMNGVFWHLAVPTFAGPGAFVATWHNVGYFSRHDDRLNDFQLILLDRSDVQPGDFDVEFRYERCEWTTGDASGGSRGFGGTPAQAGFDAGNNRDFVALPGSLTMAILDVCRTSNAGAPGLWRFQIRRGTVSVCGNGAVEAGEQCDDGNREDGDGCSGRCLLEREMPPDVIEDVPADVWAPDDVTDAPDDAGVDACTGWRCDRELRLGGRAGPLGGCTCAAAPGARAAVGSRRGAALAALAIAGLFARRRR